ncbi:hypothetical protein, partial [Aeromonas caviae]|uniref:hypothetical protein n=1 Tax=Aeromonas caviae TaxID=648 RepID=UPI001965AA2B
MTLGGAYPSTFQHFAGDAYYIAHNSTRIGFNTFLVEKTIVCFQFKGFFKAMSQLRVAWGAPAPHAS